MTSNESAVKELNNLTKTKLIEIILSKTIPNDVKLSESTRKAIEYGDTPDMMNANSEICESKYELSYKLLHMQNELKCANSELECQKKLITEMERSLSNQQVTITSQKTLIKLLESDKTNRNDGVITQEKPMPKKHKPLETTTLSPKKPNFSASNTSSSKTNGTRSCSKNYVDATMVQTGIKEAQENILSEYIINEPSNRFTDVKNNDGDWNLVANKRRKAKMLVGTGTENTNLTNVKGVPKTIDLHVYRINPGTTSEDLKALLRPHFPEVATTSLESRNPDVYSSFKVTIYQENFEKSMDASIWPRNCCVRRFLYLRRKSNQVQ